MPFVRYFVGVGGALLALLFIANIYLPKPAELPQQQRAGIDKSTIRITATQKGPERVEIDTSLPTIVPPVDVALAQSRAPNGSSVNGNSVNDTTAQASPQREAFAQMTEATKPTVAAPAPKKPKARVARSDTQRRIAMQQQGMWQQPSRVAMAQRQPSFFGGLFGTW